MKLFTVIVCMATIGCIWNGMITHAVDVNEQVVTVTPVSPSPSVPIVTESVSSTFLPATTVPSTVPPYVTTNDGIHDTNTATVTPVTTTSPSTNDATTTPTTTVTEVKDTLTVKESDVTDKDIMSAATTQRRHPITRAIWFLVLVTVLPCLCLCGIIMGVCYCMESGVGAMGDMFGGTKV